MKITFSLHAGAWNGPGAASQLGAPVLNPAGLLGFLEVQLGLSGPPAVAAKRAAAYLVALRAADTQERFYHLSLQADEMGTAAALLRWRDEWFLAGWDGKPRDGWPIRLADMAAVEAAGGGRVGLGEGQRLALVAERLGKRRVPIEKVLVLEPLHAYPSRWRAVLEQLPVEEVPPRQPQAGGDLGALQERCRAAAIDAILAPVDVFRADGSIVVTRPLSIEVAEHWLADRCHTAGGVSRMIVCEEPAAGASLDETFKATGFPTCGYSESSVLRPTVQALPLALETLWDPIEPVRLLDFLMHPVGPLPSNVRRRLGRAFADQPGIGGRAWATARDEIRKELEADDDRRVTAWLEEARYDRRVGAPLELVLARVTELRDALQARLVKVGEGGSGDADLLAGVAQCSAVLEALSELRTGAGDLVKPRLLEQLIAQATLDSTNTLAVAQVGCVPTASSVAACAAESADEVVWWMSGTPKLPTAHPWLQAELEALQSAGVLLLDPAAEMAAMMSLWVRPILAARTRLVLVLPPEGTELHPAWQLVKVLAPTISAGVLEHDDTGKVDIEARELALTQAAWKFDVAAPWRAAFPAPTRRAAQSYTSLDVAFNNPALAILQDAASLRGCNTVAPEQDNRLLGTLAHRLVQLLLDDPAALGWSEKQVSDWFGPTADELLRREGMPLLAPGSSVQLTQFKTAALGGIVALLCFLTAAGVQKVEAERPLKGLLGALELTGDADLLLHLGDGSTAALDLKWARSGRYRDMLEDGEFLQLALYSHMVEAETGQAPVAVGYFTFLDGNLSTLTPNVFGEKAWVIVPSDGQTVAQLIQGARVMWEWRVRQWQAGEVDVFADGLEAPAPEPPDGGLPIKPLGPWHVDFIRLFGQPGSEA